MRVLIATGGTGGHIYPAIALADELLSRDPQTSILFIGNNDRMEATEIPKHNYDFFGIDAKGFNGNSSDKVKSIQLMSQSFFVCRNKIKGFQPDLVVGFGGYVTVPVILAASTLHIPTVLHEQNSIAGMANRFLSHMASKIVVCYPDVIRDFPKKKTLLLGNPRASIAKRVTYDRTILKEYGLQPNRKTVFIVMGSLGSTSVNDKMISALQMMDGKDYQVIYVTGKNSYQEFTRMISDTKNVKICAYVNQVELVANVDLVVSRGGATSAAEITALQKPSIIIPSPYVPNNHQYLNAKAMLDAGCALLLEEKDLSSHQIVQMIENLIYDDQRLQEMSNRAQALGFKNAAEDIAALLEKMSGEKYE
ncbi:MAG: undecaprenyldiphospho-muramoylpentapeptide beta-N-acetylglucosaminyltransferase [Erysipelotrichaceae bacterium]|nr:undecaprenyldiphospho-muramoylpentapeptide beta-N-acetylglucosaminyltransferase [Erysipelotrichaceae bacterium]